MSSDEQDGAASREDTAHAGGTPGPDEPAVPADVSTVDASATDATDATDATEVTDAAEVTDTTDAADTADAESGSASEAADRVRDAREDEPMTRQGSGRSGPPHWLVLASAAGAAAAFVVAAVFGALWWVAAASDDAEIATTRDRVADVVRQGVIAFTEVDHENPDEFIARTKQLATGKMREGIERREQQTRDLIAQTGTKVTSTVQQVALEELNVHEGKASALATVRNDISSGEGEATKTVRLQVAMQRVDEGGEQVWKLASIGQVPVVGSGAAG